MISRRLLRIKILQVLFAHFRSENDSLNNLEKELFLSIEKSYQLYHLLLMLPEELVDFAQNKIDLGRQKLRPSPEELNPNTRFVDNKLIDKLRINQSLINYSTENRLNWRHHPELIKNIFNKFITADYYNQYMNAETVEFTDDRQLVLNLLQRELGDLEDFNNFLEEQSIYWNDDLEFVLSMATKTVKKLTESSDESAELMPMFRNEDDEDFAKKLLRKVVLRHTENVKLIEEYTQNWEVDRIAGMDILIMEMAITEIMEFPSIPVKVTLNEYIEIAKFYSTEQSSTFINGILDKIILTLRKNNQFVKLGRGLVGEDDIRLASAEEDVQD
ncbi:MAG TPA: transcription antitermination factor NusB [Tenuifilaceae bacterium]|nr:transcription antitermination factor NusB [Tenuifilaceae bacterium]HOZ13739.1 transcription antitermination factor NusB [Tenuifilaceae bacterium]HPN22556.1 transcription antitermination factor NusB [Tenuifilaceae bacterium]HPV56474.1 transcription antitermination factor NusB [Tenuifilaceae bacterium]